MTLLARVLPPPLAELTSGQRRGLAGHRSVEGRMPVEEWDSYPGYLDEYEDVDCLGPDRPDDPDEDD